MGTLATTVVQPEIDTGTASQSFSALQHALEAALIAVLLGQPAVLDARPKDLTLPVHWNQEPNTGEESFQTVPVEQLTQSDQLAAWLETYKHAAALNELESLPTNWDGQGAERVSRHAIRNAKMLLASLEGAADTFEPFADPDGGVGLEGHKRDKSAYLVIAPDGAISYVVREGAKISRGADVDASTMRQLLEVLY